MTSSPILFVIDSFRNPNAGTEGQLIQLIENLNRDRFTPYLLVFQSSAYIEKNELPCEVSVLGSSSLSSPGMWWKLFMFARKARSKGVVLAHVYFNDASVICPPIFSLFGIQTLISRRDMGYWYTPVYKFLLHLTRWFVAGVVVNSRAVAEITQKEEGISPEIIKIIYNGYIKKEQLNKDLADEHTLFSNKGDKVFFGLVANIRPIKRINDAIIALANITGECPSAELIIIGAGDSKNLMTIARKKYIAEKVHFLGARDDVHDCLQYLDIALLCSESEGFSNSIVEYMYAELPVICTNTGGNPEAITQNQTGYLYPVGEVDELSKYMRMLVKDVEKRKLIGKKACQEAIGRFSVEGMVARHEALYLQFTGD